MNFSFVISQFELSQAASVVLPTDKSTSIYAMLIEQNDFEVLRTLFYYYAGLRHITPGTFLSDNFQIIFTGFPLQRKDAISSSQRVL